MDTGDAARSGVIPEVLERDREHARSHGTRDLPVRPRRQLAIVTCMDSRLDVFGALGLELGDAHVLRNAGGIVTDDTIRSLTISQRLLGTTAVMLIHHTDCGMQRITDEGFRQELTRTTGVEPDFAIGAFTDLDESVRASVRRVRGSPFLPHRGDVRGFVYDVGTGALREVSLPTDRSSSG